MATYTYKGTAITGTSKTAKEFPKSGVSSAKVNDTYLNKEKGHVYKCTTAGAPSKAKWKYIRTDIIGKPKTGVTKLGSPTRVTVGTNTHYMKATWKVPKVLTSEKNGRRATGLEIAWSIGIPGKDKKRVVETANEALTESKINLNSFKVGRTTYTRSSFYPLNTKRTLSYVTAKVYPTNEKGKGKNKQTATRNFNTPRRPVIGDWTFNSGDGIVSNTITTDAGADYRERYDTRYQMIIEDTNSGETWNEYDTSSTSTETTLSYNVSNYQQLAYDEYIKVTIRAWARGYAGDSGTAEKTYYVAYPAQTTIEDVSVSSRDHAGKCTVFINTNTEDNPEHPVDHVKLEYLANCTYASESSIPGDASWTDSSIIDDGKCTALAVPVTNLIPDPGKYTWLRVKSYHADEAVLFRYSKPWRVDQLETPAATAADESITILGTTPGDDGKSIIVHLGWNADGLDDSTGTELTWSDAQDSWKSTDDPELYNFTWSDKEIYSLTTDTSVVTGKTYYTYNSSTQEYTAVQNPSGNPKTQGWYQLDYHDSATITIKGLNESTKYYIRARRYLEDEVTTYSPYSNIATEITTETPEAVVASCASYVATGTSLPVYWTYSGTGIQKEWQIVECHEETVGNDTVIVEGQVVAEGKGSFGATQVSFDDIARTATDGVLSFRVYISTGSGFVQSEIHTITIVDPPTLSLTTASTLTAQPYSFTATSNTECNLTVIVTSQGAVGQFPDGVKRQTAGDTIYSAVLTPVWTSENDGYSTTVTLPSGLDFWDLCNYTLSVVATDPETGLKSDPAGSEFTISWSHQAPSPVQQTFTATSDQTVNEDTVYYEYDDGVYVEVEPVGTENPSEEGWYEVSDTAYVTLTPIDTVDGDGMHIQAVQIALTAPANSAQTDVYDIYRVTGDGAYLIGEGFPLSYTATDNYAPFGDAMTQIYRLAVRTVDGDVEFSDIEYVASGAMMRFDWAGGTLELPYNISIGDKYKKDVSVRKHMDGTNDAYWNTNIDRTGSLSSDLIRLDQQENVVLARELAHYAGPVFVRTPDGSAYEADVQVTNMSTDGLLEAIAIDATEIGLTDEFILPTPFALEE